MKQKQTNLFDYFDMKAVRQNYGRTTHGGVQTKKHRKLQRPLDTNKWIHLILKSDKAYGKLSLLSAKNQIYIKEVIKEKSKKFGIKIDDFANVGNHLHLKIKISSRKNFQRFLKSITALISRHVTGARKGKAFGRFWQGLAFTRVLMSSLEVLNLKGYIKANRIEAAHSTEAREQFLKRFNNWVYKERIKSKNLEPCSAA